MRSIDLNCDMGEGCGNDEQLLEYVTSANVACGYHAGDEPTMRATAKSAITKGVAVGAHPGFPDRENFGRTEMQLTHHEVFEIVADQIIAMKAICESLGARLNHVKPHGALYNMAARDAHLARSIAAAVKNVDPDLVLYGLSSSHLISEGRALGLATASEAFADRSYSADGKLTPRSQPGALINSENAAIRQVSQMIEGGSVITLSGETVPLLAETICIHGDGEHAVTFARAIRAGLLERGIHIRPITR